MFIEAKDDGGSGDNWTTGAINPAKLQSNHHHQQTNIQFLQAGCPSCRPTNSVKELKEKISHSMDLLTPSSPGGLPALFLHLSIIIWCFYWLKMANEDKVLVSVSSGDVLYCSNCDCIDIAEAKALQKTWKPLIKSQIIRLRNVCAAYQRFTQQIYTFIGIPININNFFI